MPLVGRILGPVLGPRGKMPIPVPPNADIAALIKKHRKTVVVRMRNQPIIQVSVGSATDERRRPSRKHHDGSSCP